MGLQNEDYTKFNGFLKKHEAEAVAKIKELSETKDSTTLHE